MGVLSEALGNSGAKHTIEFDGKTIEMRYVDQAMKGAIEKHLFKKAIDAEVMMKEARTPEEHEAKLKELGDGFVAGQFAFESRRGLAFIQSEPGAIKLGSLIMGVDEMEVLRIFQSSKTEVTTMIALVLRESFRLEKKQE